MFFRDPVNSKWTSYVLIVNYFANNQTEVLNFTLGVTAYSNLDQDVNASQAIRIPNNILLVKQ
jgi:glutamate mutase epsilon subunit